MTLPCLPIKAGWSRVHPRDYLRVAGEIWTGQKPIRQGLLVLEIPHGGIGDHLFYTALVDALSPSTSDPIGLVDQFHLSVNSADNYGGRLFDLIWKPCPFLTDFTRAPGWTHSGLRPVEGNFCDGMVAQLAGRLPRPSTTRPKMWRRTPRPRYYENLPYVVIDFNRRSNQDRLEGHLDAICRHKNEVLGNQFRDHAFVNYHSPVSPHGCPPEVDLGDYFSMIEHCAAFFGCYSGGAVLAAAYGKPAWIYCHHRDPSQSFDIHHYVEMGR